MQRDRSGPDQKRLRLGHPRAIPSGKEIKLHDPRVKQFSGILTTMLRSARPAGVRQRNAELIPPLAFGVRKSGMNSAFRKSWDAHLAGSASSLCAGQGVGYFTDAHAERGPGDPVQFAFWAAQMHGAVDMLEGLTWTESGGG
jgi:hypothetical protein